MAPQGPSDHDPSQEPSEQGEREKNEILDQANEQFIALTDSICHMRQGYIDSQLVQEGFDPKEVAETYDPDAGYWKKTAGTKAYDRLREKALKEESALIAEALGKDTQEWSIRVEEPGEFGITESYVDEGIPLPELEEGEEPYSEEEIESIRFQSRSNLYKVTDNRIMVATMTGGLIDLFEFLLDPPNKADAIIEQFQGEQEAGVNAVPIEDPEKARAVVNFIRGVRTRLKFDFYGPRIPDELDAKSWEIPEL